MVRIRVGIRVSDVKVQVRRRVNIMFWVRISDRVRVRVVVEQG